MCDMSTAISAGLQLIMSDGDGESAQGYSDAAGQAALKSAALEEQKFELLKADYLYARPYQREVIGAARRQLPRAEDQYLKDLSVRDRTRQEVLAAGGEDEQEAAGSRAVASTAEGWGAPGASPGRTMRSLGLAKPGDQSYAAGARGARVGRGPGAGRPRA